MMGRNRLSFEHRHWLSPSSWPALVNHHVLLLSSRLVTAAFLHPRTFPADFDKQVSIDCPPPQMRCLTPWNRLT